MKPPRQTIEIRRQPAGHDYKVLRSGRVYCEGWTAADTVGGARQAALQHAREMDERTRRTRR